jgi:hypothetical protein
MPGRRSLIAACLAAFLGAGVAHAQFRLAPDWAETPDSERLSRRYPKVAQALALPGRALLSCRVAIPTGVLQRCSVIEEQPKGLGFGAAALDMASDFQMRAPLAPGQRQPDDIVRIPIVFKLPEVPPAIARSPDAPRLALARRVAKAMPLDAAVTRRIESDARRLSLIRDKGVETTTTDAAAAAVRGALPEVLPVWRDRFASVLAAQMSERDLAAVVAFAETAEGRRYLGSMDGLSAEREAISGEARRRARAAMREAFCARLDCDAKTVDQAVIETLGGEDPPEPIVAWDRRPTEDDLHRAWPLARTLDLTGMAALVCVIGAQGAPEECRVAMETPGGLGVGAAALAVSDRHRLPAHQVTAGAVGRKVLVMTAFVDVVGRDRATAPAAPPPEVRRELARRLLAASAVNEAAPAWEEALAKDTASMSVLPEGVRTVAAAALRSGYETGDKAFRELSVDLLAAELDETTLRAAVAFEAGGGAALRRAIGAAEEELERLSRAMQARLAEVAATRFCQSFDCRTSPPQASGESSAPSTRTP